MAGPKQKKSRLRRLIRAICIAAAALLLLAAVPACAVLAGTLYYKNRDAKAQAERIEMLGESYASAGFTPVSEDDFTAFDLAEALESGVKLNEVQFLATHNSYKQRLSVPARLALNYIGLPLGLVSEKDEFDYAFEPLTAQLDRGVRSLELDIMKDGEDFRAGHVGLLDMRSSCPGLALACREIAMWSRAHPGHLPITLLLEPKPSIMADGKAYRPFGLDGIAALESLLAREFGDLLCTPGEVLGDCESFGALRRDNAWPPLRDLLGRVLVLYHYHEATTADYIALDLSMRTQKMFPTLWYPLAEDMDTEYAGFILCNEPMDYAEEIAAFTAQNLLVRTRVDMFMHHDPQAYALGVQSGALLLTTDYPPRDIPGKDPYTAALDGGYTIRLRGDTP